MKQDKHSGPPVLFLMGPTASGKTELALALREHLPVELVSVDSAMVYRGMDIGTAKPTKEILKTAPHKLIDICDPAEAYSAGRFREDALQAIKEIHQQGRIPLLVGGTGLYFRSLEQGFSELPASDENIRQRLEQQAGILGWEKMHARLGEVDPASAERIHPNDPQRIQRALEVYEITGQPLSGFIEKGRTEPLAYPVYKLVIAPEDRAVLQGRIEQRFQQMLKTGLLEEVRELYAREDLHAGLPSMRLVGYRQVWRYLSGEYDDKTMINKAIIATRQLAKRQMTWLRSEREAEWFDSLDHTLHKTVLKFVKRKSIF